MESISRHKTKRKRGKPHRDFPLFRHQTNRWAKKIKGRFVYFGSTITDPDGKNALNLWLAQKDDLLAGRPAHAPGDGLTLLDASNRYLEARRHLVDTHEITFRHWDECRKSLQALVNTFGKTRPVLSLRPEDFTRLRGVLAEGRGPDALGNHVQRIRSFFKWLWDSDLIDRPVKFGQEFRRPGKAAMRRARQARPQRILSREEVLRLLDIATPPVKAMILLAVNAGLGPADCATLPIAALDLDRGILDYPRVKTATERRSPLWPETVTAVRAVLETRPTPKDPDHAGLLFLTKYGRPWVRYGEKGNVNAVCLEFGKLLTKLGIKRAGVGFYALRHLCETIGGELGDQAGMNRIMGHADNTMAGVYREWLRDEREDARLRRITDHVLAWLLGEAEPSTDAKTAAASERTAQTQEVDKTAETPVQ